MSADAITYRGTGLTVVAGDRAVVLVNADPEADLIRALWQVVHSGANLPHLIETLAGHGLAGLPDFGLVSWIGTHATLLVRGGVTATVQLAGGDAVTVSGQGVTTWLERGFTDTRRVVFAGAGPAGRGATALSGGIPLVAGVARASVVACDLMLAPARPATVGPAVPGHEPTINRDQLQPQAGTPRQITPVVRSVPQLTGASASAAPPIGQPHTNPTRPADPTPSRELEPFPDKLAPAVGEAPPIELAPPIRQAPPVQLAPPVREMPSVEPPPPPIGATPVMDAVPPLDALPPTGVMPVVGSGPAVPPPPLTDHIWSQPGEPALYSEDESQPTWSQHPGVPTWSGAWGRAGPDASWSSGPEAQAWVEPFPEVARASGGLMDRLPDGPTPILPAGGTQTWAFEPNRPRLGDHDDHTVPRDEPPAELVAQPAEPSLTTVTAIARTVRAVTCPAGHPNRPADAACRVCHATLDEGQAPVDIQAPTLGLLRLSTGQTAPLVRAVTVIGREPRAPGLDAALIAPKGASGNISRLHAEIRVREWTVEVVDLGSTNGTRVINPAGDPVQLEPRQPVPLLPGGVIDLAGEVSITFEVSG